MVGGLSHIDAVSDGQEKEPSSQPAPGVSGEGEREDDAHERRFSLAWRRAMRACSLAEALAVEGLGVRTERAWGVSLRMWTTLATLRSREPWGSASSPQRSQ